MNKITKLESEISDLQHQITLKTKELNDEIDKCKHTDTYNRHGIEHCGYCHKFKSNGVWIR